MAALRGCHMIDVALLAGTVVSQLLLPVFRAGWDAVFDAAADEVGDVVAEETKGVVSSLWGRLRGAFTSDEEKAALSSFEKRPESTAALLEELLRERFEKEPDLAAEINRLVETKPAGGTLNGAQVIGRTVNQLVLNGRVERGAIVGNQIFGVPLSTPLPSVDPPSGAGPARGDQSSRPDA